MILLDSNQLTTIATYKHQVHIWWIFSWFVSSRVMNCEPRKMEFAWHGIAFSQWWSRYLTSQNARGHCARTLLGTSDVLIVSQTIQVEPFALMDYFCHTNIFLTIISLGLHIDLYISMHQKYFICLYNMIKDSSLMLHNPIYNISLICRVCIAGL